MTEKEFLEKYGNENFTFEALKKTRIEYKSEKLGISIFGNIDDIVDMRKVESVYTFKAEIENFSFKISQNENEQI